jgi:hypothetical protein
MKNSRKINEFFLKIPGKFQKNSRKIPGKFQENSRKIPGKFQENSRKFFYCDSTHCAPSSKVLYVIFAGPRSPLGGSYSFSFCLSPV